MQGAIPLTHAGTLLVLLCMGSVASAAAWWTPPQTFQWQWDLDSWNGVSDILVDTPTDNVTVYDLHLYNIQKADVDALHARGKKVVCYFEAGTWNRAGPYGNLYPGAADCLSASPKCACGKQVCGGLGLPYEPPYVAELWLNVSDPGVLAVVDKILDLAQAKGCDAVEPDNVQGFERDSYCTGFEHCGKCTGPNSTWTIGKVCQADYDMWLNFNKYLANGSHARGMGIANKNNYYQAATLAFTHDFQLSEQCLQYNECGPYSAFTARGLAVLLTEYSGTTATICPKVVKAAAAGAGQIIMSAMRKSTSLTATDRKPCCGSGAAATACTTFAKKAASGRRFL